MGRYVIAWFLGVPAFVLVIIFFLMNLARGADAVGLFDKEDSCVSQDGSIMKYPVISVSARVSGCVAPAVLT